MFDRVNLVLLIFESHLVFFINLLQRV